MKHHITFSPRRVTAYIAVAALVVVASFLAGQPARAAACAAPTTDYGSATTSISAPSNGTYRIWSRLMVPNSTNNTYMLEVDGQNCFVVGGAAIPANTWTWVDYQNTNAKVDMSLTQGTHNLKFIGRQSGVKLDRVIIASDLQCVPTGNGDNCNVPSDTTPPAVDITAPVANATISGQNIAVAATASDDAAVTKVEFFVNSTLITTDTSTPYGFTWDTTKGQNGQQRVTAKAYDAAGNVSSDSVTVTVQNGDSEAPSSPTGLAANVVAYNDIRLSWKTSTDNAGIKGYLVHRNGTVLTQVDAVTSYTDTTASPSTTYTYQLIAIDTSDNKSAATSPISVQTPALSTADTSVPSTPQQLAATTITSRQINLVWAASTDNIGVTGYDVYRATGGGSAQKVATVTTTSYGDTGLQAKTQYSYFVKARDAAGNTSDQSTTVSAETLAKKRKSRITGTVATTTNKAIAKASVTVTVEGVKYTATTNSRGKYEIRDVPRGRYTVTFKATGYKSKSLPLVAENRTAVLNAKLTKK